MDKLNEKQFKILSTLLLAEKPLNTTEIAALSGYPRTTIQPYVNNFVDRLFFIDEQ